MTAELQIDEAHELCDDPEFCQRLFIAICNARATGTLSGDYNMIERQRRFWKKQKGRSNADSEHSVSLTPHAAICYTYLDALSMWHSASPQGALSLMHCRLHSEGGERG